MSETRKIFEAAESAGEAKKLAELFHENKKEILTVSSRSVTDAFFRMNGMEQKSEEIRAAIAELPKADETAVRERLINDVRMLPCKVETLFDFVSSKGSAADTVFALERYCGFSAEYDEAVVRFKSLVFMLLVYGVPADFLNADLCFPGDAQFSGTVFKIGDISGGFIGKR